MATGVFISRKSYHLPLQATLIMRRHNHERLSEERSNRRDHALIRERGLRAKLISKPYERAKYEATVTRFVEFQTTIEAPERALVSEAVFLDARWSAVPQWQYGGLAPFGDCGV
jgi:hypothetical protein